MQQPREAVQRLVSPQCSHLNVGSGEEVRIGALAMMVAEATGFEGTVSFDRSKPDGTPRKLVDASRLRSLGWAPRISLAEGLRRTVRYFEAAQSADCANLAYRGMGERPHLRS